MNKSGSLRSVHLTLSITPTALAELRKLKELLGACSDSETVRMAVKSMKAIIESVGKNPTFIGPDGKKTSFIIL